MLTALIGCVLGAAFAVLVLGCSPWAGVSGATAAMLGFLIWRAIDRRIGGEHG